MEKENILNEKNNSKSYDDSIDFVRGELLEEIDITTIKVVDEKDINGQ